MIATAGSLIIRMRRFGRGNISTPYGLAGKLHKAVGSAVGGTHYKASRLARRKSRDLAPVLCHSKKLGYAVRSWGRGGVV